MKPTDLALNRALGMVAAPAGAAHLLELPRTPAVLNHVGTVHAAAQFALAEAASAAALQRDFPEADGRVLAVVRAAAVKYRRPAQDYLLAYAAPDAVTLSHLASDLATRTRTRATVGVELKQRDGTLIFTATFEWFIARTPEPAS